jgi:transcription antitermination factor NusG
MQEDELCWYAIYSAPRAEKKVSERFEQAEIEHYLPLHKVMRRWSDRIKEVVVPVVYGYLFVRIRPAEFRKVLNVFGAISFVREFGLPVQIPDSQIERLKFMVNYSDEPVEFSLEQYEPGETIKITRGPLQGLIGELIEVRGKHKVVIRLERFGCALTTIPLSFLEKEKSTD